MPINNQSMPKHNGIPYPYGSVPGTQPVNPYGGLQQPFQNTNPFMRAPINETHLSRVKGINGAQEYPISFNSEVALFDEEEDVFYVKQADANGYTRLTKYRYEEVVDEPTGPSYVTMEDFEKFKKEVLDGQQRIQKTLKSNGYARNSKPVPANSGNQHARSNDEFQGKPDVIDSSNGNE